MHSQVERQRIRFDSEADDYMSSRSDAVTQSYRDRFFRDRLLNFDLDGRRVLDAMCAGGVDAEYFLRRGARLEGLDISPRFAELFTANTGCPCTVASIDETGFPTEAFDVVWICGGLHHIAHKIPESIAEIHRLLRPGGYFCIREPNADTWLNLIRRAWYKRSERFDDSERALSYKEEVRPFLTLGFEEELVFYGGNVGHLLILQSGVLGVPPSVKNTLRAPIFAVESLLTRPALFWCARWRKL